MLTKQPSEVPSNAPSPNPTTLSLDKTLATPFDGHLDDYWHDGDKFAILNLSPHPILIEQFDIHI